MKDLLRIADLGSGDLELILDEAAAVKADPYRYRDALRGDTVALYFAKPSTRTRLAFEAAVVRLAGVPSTIGPGELHLARGERLEDTAACPPTVARRRPPRSSTGHGRSCSTRPATSCTSRRQCCTRCSKAGSRVGPRRRPSPRTPPGSSPRSPALAVGREAGEHRAHTGWARNDGGGVR
jgi:Aspartate/ornithine carbamoyltransferase, carbamoyl-P binding domain